MLQGLADLYLCGYKTLKQQNNYDISYMRVTRSDKSFCLLRMLFSEKTKLDIYSRKYKFHVIVANELLTKFSKIKRYSR